MGLPVCRRRGAAASPSTSTNSSPRESEASYSFNQSNGKSDPRASSTSVTSSSTPSTATRQTPPAMSSPSSAKNGHVMVHVNGPEEQLNHVRSGTSATTSLPSIRTMGILDNKHWPPPTDAMAHVSLVSNNINNNGAFQQSTTNLNHLLVGRDDGRLQNSWIQQQVQPVGNVRQTSGGLPVGLDWLNNE